MRALTNTSTALLEGLRDAHNQTVWSDYVGRYRPLIVAYCRRLGLPASDAEDVAQDALWTFAASYRDGKYDRERGRLRAWLFGIVKNVMLRWRRRAGDRRVEHAPELDGGASGDALAQFADDDRLWEDEWRKAILRRCLEEVRAEVEAKTFRAFELFAVEGWPAARVAAELETTENAVFIAKHRVLRRVQAMLPQLERDF